jgi:hypothetical protein
MLLPRKPSRNHAAMMKLLRTTAAVLDLLVEGRTRLLCALDRYLRLETVMLSFPCLWKA